MIGSYDNQKQSSAGAAVGKFTALDGGHEYVSANIAQHPFLDNVLIATYFYEADITRTFRYRFYEFMKDDSKSIIMKLYRPLLATEEKLKKLGYVVEDAKLPDIKDLEYLSDCDVIWKKNLSSYTGLLVKGQARVKSLANPAVDFLVKDELKLRKSELWINDRVYTSDGQQIIGNKDGIPYKMDKKKPQRDSFGAKQVYEPW